jgi:hypothetical protein
MASGRLQDPRTSVLAEMLPSSDPDPHHGPAGRPVNLTYHLTNVGSNPLSGERILERAAVLFRQVGLRGRCREAPRPGWSVEALTAIAVPLGALSALATLHSVRSSLQYWLTARQASRRGNDAPEPYAPEATLIVPCCGEEEGLDENLEVHRESLVRLYEELRPLYRHYAEKIGRRKGWPDSAGGRLTPLGRRVSFSQSLQAVREDGSTSGWVFVHARGRAGGRSVWRGGFFSCSWPHCVFRRWARPRAPSSGS